ncbi:MAG TPA: type II toxin-antitoxin system RelE/ParE family toxin [Bryobacteraceae bacterium]|nr:type II toxin-antitoxin system RelE/ParE family toxin [Bryobacteraceae bacterium]
MKIVLSEPAKQDIAAILERSLREFGEAAALRYKALIRQGLRDIQADPERIGSSDRPDLAPGVRTWHLRLSCNRVTGNRVKNPRHRLIYRRRERGIEVIRILHDGQDLKRHLPES